MYPKETELKVEHHGIHASFLDLVIKTEDSVFVYKLFEIRGKFSFFIARVPHLSSNITSTILYGSIFSELLRIVRCTLRINDFIAILYIFLFENDSTRRK